MLDDKMLVDKMLFRKLSFTTKTTTKNLYVCVVSLLKAVKKNKQYLFISLQLFIKQLLKFTYFFTVVRSC